MAFNLRRLFWIARQWVQEIVVTAPSLALEVLRTSLRMRLPRQAAEMAFLTVLGFLAGSFALIAVTQHSQAGEILFTPVVTALSRLLPLSPLNRLGDGNLGLVGYRGAIAFVGSLWLFSTAMGTTLRSLDLMHQIPVAHRRTGWRRGLLALALSLCVICGVGLAFTLIYVAGGAAGPTAHTVAEGTVSPEGSGSQLLWNAIRRLLALGSLLATFTVVYRFGPSRFFPGYPILPGICGAAIGVLGALVGVQQFVNQSPGIQAGINTLGLLLIFFIGVYIGNLVTLVGNQFNVCLRYRIATRSLPNRFNSPALPPPSFDSFTINRHTDRFP